MPTVASFLGAWHVLAHQFMCKSYRTAAMLEYLSVIFSRSSCERMVARQSSSVANEAFGGEDENV